MRSERFLRETIFYTKCRDDVEVFAKCYKHQRNVKISENTDENKFVKIELELIYQVQEIIF